MAVWGLREGVGTEARAQAPAEWRARYWGGPAPAMPPAAAKETAALKERLSVPQPEVMGDTVVVQPAAAAVASRGTEALVLRGVVTDASTNEGLPGVTILLKDTLLGASTRSDGSFELAVPAVLAKGSVRVAVSFIGYLTQQHALPTAEAFAPQHFQLQADTRMLGELTIVPIYRKMPPAPWHPRRFYYWSKYWLTRPFHRG